MLTPTATLGSSKVSCIVRIATLGLALLVFFILPLLWYRLSTCNATRPTVRFDNPMSLQTLLRNSRKLKIDYYVDPSEVTTFSMRDWKELDQYAEGQYVPHLSAQCQWEQQTRQRAFRDAQGYFKRDEVKWQKAKDVKMPACRRLQAWGSRTAY